MKIAVIGAGFTGLSSAYRLAKHGHHVVVFEKDAKPGGLAVGYKEKEWEWTLEKHYHHWFTNDDSVLNLAKEINHDVIITRPHTNWFIHDKIYEFDSIPAALKFKELSVINRVRNLATLTLFRFNPFWKPLERIHATTSLPLLMGQKTYSLLWEPLFVNKFGPYAKDVSLAWFWARIKKRTQSLAYPKGGFLRFAETVTKKIRSLNGEVLFNAEITNLTSEREIKMTYMHNSKTHKKTFDKAIVTLSSFLFLKIAPQLPESYKKSLSQLKGLGATNIVLRLKKPFFPDNTYWLSVADQSSPIMAIVEHTNFMDKRHYNNEHLVYLGNYLSHSDARFSQTKEETLRRYDPLLRKINADYKTHLIDYELFKAPFAQPIIPINYSRMLPPFHTPLPHVFLCNIQQVYPWDRGTNYAVELGEIAAKRIMEKNETT